MLSSCGDMILMSLRCMLIMNQLIIDMPHWLLINQSESFIAPLPTPRSTNTNPLNTMWLIWNAFSAKLWLTNYVELCSRQQNSNESSSSFSVHELSGFKICFQKMLSKLVETLQRGEQALTDWRKGRKEIRHLQTDGKGGKCPNFGVYKGEW